MEPVTYLRPREKLQMRGSASLSVAELLQIIIGSGTVKASASHLSRKVATLLDTMPPQAIRLTDLTQINGLGFATACRVLAVIALSERLVRHSNHPPVVSTPSFDRAYFAQSKKQVGIYITQDGSGKTIKSYKFSPHPKESTLLMARKICTQALVDGASGISVQLGAKTQSLEPSLVEVSLLQDLKTVSQVLQLTINSLTLVNKTSQAQIYGSLI